MKRVIAGVLLLSLALGLLLPSVAMATDGRLAMKPAGGGNVTPPAGVLEYYTGSALDKWAVLIGISDYYKKNNDLWNPHNDALEMKQILAADGYNYAICLNSMATQANIYLLMDWLVSHEGPGSEVVFFYSGHGSRTADGSWDADVESDGYDECIVSYDLKAISDSYMDAKFSAMESNHIAAVYASCHSGGMFDQTYEVRSGMLYIAAAEADQYGWDYLELMNTLFFYWWGDQAILNGPYSNMQDAFWYARPIVIAEQPDSCPTMLDNLGVPFYVK